MWKITGQAVVLANGTAPAEHVGIYHGQGGGVPGNLDLAVVTSWEVHARFAFI